MCFLPRNARREDGCTLVELLIGVAILGLLMTLIVMTFSSTFGAIEMVDDESETNRRARILVGVMTEELMAARMHQWFPFIGQDGASAGYAQDTLAFVSANGERQAAEVLPQSGAIRIVYTRDGDHLVRMALRNLYSTGPEPVERVDLASGVVAFNVRYYDGKTGTWQNEWNGQARKTLPSAVFIELAFADARNELRTISNMVLISAESSR